MLPRRPWPSGPDATPTWRVRLRRSGRQAGGRGAGPGPVPSPEPAWGWRRDGGGGNSTEQTLPPLVGPNKFSPPLGLFATLRVGDGPLSRRPRGGGRRRRMADFRRPGPATDGWPCAGRQWTNPPWLVPVSRGRPRAELRSVHWTTGRGRTVDGSGSAAIGSEPKSK